MVFQRFVRKCAVSNRGVALCLLLGVLLVGSCDGNGPSQSDNPAATSGEDASIAAVPCDVPGEFRCNPDAPEVLELCDPSTSLGWSEFLRCASPELCDAEGERCLICSPGGYRCDGWRLQRCSEDGSKWQLEDECPSEDYCDSSQGSCLACLNGQGFCDQEKLFSCSQSQDSFEVEVCPSADLCNVSSMSCRACFPGEYQCSGADLMRCDDAQTWQAADSCATPALCVATVAVLADSPDASAVCMPAACEQGTYRCNPDSPTHLEGCPPSLAGFELIDICDQASQCDASAGVCRAGCGVPGTYRCNGMALQHCDLDGIEWVNDQICNSADECNVAKKDCALCNPGDHQCNDNLLQQCEQDQRWTTLEVCFSASLCQVDEAQAEQHCRAGCGVPGMFRCNGEQLEECALDAVNWQLRDVCDSASLCDAVDGRCTPPGCPSAGLVVCQGQSLLRCREDLSSWDAIRDCAPGTLCDIATSDCATECPDVEVRCNGAQPERCVVNEQGPVWQAAAAPCASFGLCSFDAIAETVACSEPACGGALPEYRCADGTVEECNEARTAFEPYRVCPEQSTCDVGAMGAGPPECDVCAASAFSCTAGGELQRCASDGQSVSSVQSCRDAAHCVVEAEATQGHCVVCDVGETRCNAGNLERCAEDRRSWVAERECEPENGCHDGPGAADYCNECPVAGEASCNGTTALRTCAADQRSYSADIACEYGCQTGTGGGDYCRECSPNSAECSSSNSKQRRMCNALGEWDSYTDCPDDSSCNDRGTTDFCGACSPNTFTCTSETERQSCTAAGTPGAIAACPTETPYCLDGNCVPCREGDAPQCPSGQGSQDRRVCSAEGQWVTNVCPFPTSICSEGNCVACLPDTAQCTGTNGGRTECVNGQLIVANCVQSGLTACLNGACVACNPNVDQPRCTANGDREYCDAQGRWQVQDCTGSTSACVSGVCQQCNPATQPDQCVASQGASGRQVCNNGSWQNAACAEPTPVCVGAGDCVCENDDYRCAPSGVRQQCVNRVWADAPCDSGSCSNGECTGCVDSQDCSPELPMCNDEGVCVCADDSERCMGTTHQVCSDGDWMADMCPDATPVCNQTTGGCECQSGGTRCEQGVQQSCVAGAWVNDEGNPACSLCESNEECSGNTPICDGSCVACSGNDCPNDLVCAASGACVQCTTADVSQCPPETPVCSTDNQCVECTASADDRCAGDTPVCNNAGQCVGCEEDAQCGDLVCDTAVGACVECTPINTDECPPATPACTDDNVCVECTGDGDCTGTYCDLVSNTCVECLSSDQCPDEKPSCNVATHACIGCTSDATCSTTTVCSDGACVECTPTNTTKCDEDEPACQNNTCVACSASDGDYCTDQGLVCKVESNTCVECTSDEQCPDEVCNTTTNVCGPCQNGTLCPNLLVCVAGSCVPCVPAVDDDPGVPCPGGLSCSDEGVCIQ